MASLITPSKRSTTNQTFGLLAAVLIGAGFYASYSYFMPDLQKTRNGLAQAEAELESVRTDVRTLQNAQNSLDTATKRLEQRGLKLELVSQIVPADEDIPGLYVQFDQIVEKASGVSKPTYQIGIPTKDTAGGASVKMSVSTTGTYANLKKFLAAFQSNIRPVTFTTVTLTAVPAQQVQGLDGKITVVAGDVLYALQAEGYVRAQGLSAAYQDTTL